MPRRWWLLLVGVVVVSTAVGIDGQRDEPPRLRDLLARAAVYLDRFEREFALVVSDEIYHQQIGVQPGAGGDRVRDTRAEMVFLWVPQEELWITARSVLEVDGQPVPESEGRLQRALLDEAGRAGRVRRMRTDTARYNIGDVYRNFNAPTFALQVLDRRMQERFRWRRGEPEAVDTVDTWRLDFEEKERPTLVRHEGADMRLRGTIWVAAETGAIHRTRIELANERRRTRARIDVVFRRDDKLDLVVPATMEERYDSASVREDGARPRLVENEPIIARAVYSNYRRFETSGRLIVP
jgi:hypothetical protein